jgi:hypothetical protein
MRYLIFFALCFPWNVISVGAAVMIGKEVVEYFDRRSICSKDAKSVAEYDQCMNPKSVK